MDELAQQRKIPAPTPIPEPHKAEIGKLTGPLKEVFNEVIIPYSLQAHWAGCGYSNLGDVYDRWTTPQEARLVAPETFAFGDT